MSNVIVAGGGFAGLASACRLAGDGYAPWLVERAPRLGGRAASFRDRMTGEMVDDGHHVLLRCCTAAQGFLHRIGADDAVQFQEAFAVPILHEKARTVLRSSSWPGPLHLVPGLLRYAPLLWKERVSAVRAGWALLIGGGGRDLVFGDWLARHGQRANSIRRFWDPVCIATLNAPTDAVGLAAARKVFRDAFFQPHGADLGWFSVPLADVFDAARTYIESRGGRVELSMGVRSIGIEDGCLQGVELTDGRSVDTEVVIAAIPPERLRAILPNDQAHAVLAGTEGLRWSPIVNAHFWFDQPVFEDPFFVAIESPVQAVFDVTRLHHGNRGTGKGETSPYHVVLSQSAATEWIERPADEVTVALLESLADLAPRVRSARLVHHLVVRHPRATFLPDVASSAHRPLSKSSVRGLYLAGDWTATGWPSTIEGAIRSGIAAGARCQELLMEEDGLVAGSLE